MRNASLGIVAFVTACSHSGATPDASGIGSDATNHDASFGDGGVPLPAAPHGLFMLNPQGRDIASTFLTAGGPGTPYIKGATIQVHWSDLQPSGPATFQLAAATTTTIDAWTAAGKQVNLVFQASNYNGGNFVPTWYARTLPISSATQASGSKTIAIALATGVNAGQGGFLVDVDLTGSNPLLGAQSIQIAGTAALDGVYPIATISSDGKTVTATAPTAATTAKSETNIGTVGNPMFSCTSNNVTVTLPVYWGPNFELAWEGVMDEVKTHLDGQFGYFRFGMGTGGENSPVKPLDTSCESELEAVGFSSAPVPWTTYNVSASSWETTVAPVWIAFQHDLISYVASKQFATQVMLSLSTIDYAPGEIDYGTADAVGPIATAAGLGIGNQGWRQSDGTTTASGVCAADYCALFPAARGVVPLELQTVLASDPDNTTMNPSTGDLSLMLPEALGRGAQIFELYADDLSCAFDPAFDGDPNANPAYVTTYAGCTAHNFPAAIEAAAAALH